MPDLQPAGDTDRAAEYEDGGEGIEICVGEAFVEEAFGEEYPGMDGMLFPEFAREGNIGTTAGSDTPEQEVAETAAAEFTGSVEPEDEAIGDIDEEEAGEIFGTGEQRKPRIVEQTLF